jgi:DNA-directed RNA polymerase subunit RPC12/RpoP
MRSAVAVEQEKWGTMSLYHLLTLRQQIETKAMRCPKCDQHMLRSHRPGWLRPLRWAKLYICTHCNQRFLRFARVDTH